ncbi:MAG: sodium:solute symporter family protein [Panacagrimonas sp.]
MNIVLTCILLYVVLQLAIAFAFARRHQSEVDYLLAGRSLGPWMSTFTVFATWYGAETCLGATGEAYAHGVSGVLADPFGYAVGIVLMGLIFGSMLWKKGIVTTADLFRSRYGTGVELLAAAVMVPSTVMWAAAQVRGFGQILASVSEVGLVLGITLAAVVVIAYTAVGGMWADAITDLVQGLVLIAGVVVLFIVFLNLGGHHHLAGLPAARLDPLHDRSWFDALDTLAVPIFSTIAAQELVSRVLAMRSAALARSATVAAGILYLAMGLIPVVIGLGAATYIGADRDPEQVLSLFAQQNLPLPLYILFLGALVSAILSTLSGALLVAGSLAAHNVYAALRPGMSEAHKLKANRYGVVLFGLIAYAVALASESMYALVQEASSIGTSGILVLLVFAVWAPRLGGVPSAFAALVTGTATYLVAAHLVGMESPYLLSVGVSLAAYLLLSPFGRLAPAAGLASSQPAVAPPRSEIG